MTIQRYYFNLNCARKTGYLTLGVEGVMKGAVRGVAEVLVLGGEVVVLPAEMVVLRGRGRRSKVKGQRG